jgi:CubicO group peptidase (beta-lactamase class C family)
VYLWRPDEPGQARPADALSYYATLPNDGAHGGPFRYRSILTDVLGWVLERAGGARLHELIARELWRPMGAEFDAEVTVDGHGNAMADGGVCATLRDLARFGQVILDAARGRGRVVPAAWVADTIRGAPDGVAAFAQGDGRGYPPGAHYRNCWWSGTRACLSCTPRASTGSTSWCTCRRRRSWSSCPPGRWPPASGWAS